MKLLLLCYVHKMLTAQHLLQYGDSIDAVAAGV